MDLIMIRVWMKIQQLLFSIIGRVLIFQVDASNMYPHEDMKWLTVRGIKEGFTKKYVVRKKDFKYYPELRNSKGVRFC